MSGKLHCLFFGNALHSSLNYRNIGNCLFLDRREYPRRVSRKCKCEKRQNDWIMQAIRFSHFCGENVELLRKTIGSRNGLVVKSVKEPFVRSKALVKSLAPLWKEGLLLMRCSVLVAVISGVCLLVWYGQRKAKSFIEAKLLPSVCSMLSEYIQRELDFGKVRRVSPLSITLESCSIGPHRDEFSCGEVPTMKLRVRPFASLRRGKIVIDAVLSNPSVLIVQKKDFTWLGIPSSEDGFLHKHLSTEEGIDYRTKSRRIAREAAATCWSRDRDDMAREAAEIGYIVSEKSSYQSQDKALQEAIHSTELASSENFICMDEKMHWSEHHCMDTGIDYDMKHADLEKSFGVKIPGSGLKFWSKVIKGPQKHKFKKANGTDMSTAGVTAKIRILERSALAAVVYFQGLVQGKSDEPSQASTNDDVLKFDDILVKSEDDTSASTSIDMTSCEDHLLANSQNGKPHKDFKLYPLAANQNVNGYLNKFQFIRDPFLMTVGRLSGVRKFRENFPSVSNVVGVTKKSSSCINSEDLVVDVVNKCKDNNKPESQGVHTSQNPTSVNLGPHDSIYNLVSVWPLGLKSDLLFFSRNVRELLSNIFAGPFKELKSGVAPNIEDVVAELVDGVSIVQNEGAKQMLPVALDSVHFKGGTLMLLAYGDREPREMENASGHVRLQNHYGRVHVQVSGNCKMWRTDMMSGDGGWLSADVFVDNIEKQWHANLKIVNLFAPLFERILEIPITWSKGRATGEVHICMSRGETFPNLHGQLDITGLTFQIFDAPSWFSDISTSLWFRGQRIFLHNASGWFGSVPLEASGDFGIHPEEGEFHLMCQAWSVKLYY